MKEDTRTFELSDLAFVIKVDSDYFRSLGVEASKETITVSQILAGIIVVTPFTAIIAMSLTL